MLDTLLGHSRPDAIRRLDEIQQQLNRILLGKQEVVRLALACLLARGHLLIEDLPGVGKTTLAQSLARVLGLDFNRIQFTSDMLPADVIGVSIYDGARRAFSFHPGPLFSQVVLADEINRASPKAQSALLEAMEERQVSADGASRALPEPFFVIATQNPHEHSGTFPLPESQLDRFTMTLSIGYPARSAEHDLLTGRDRAAMLAELAPATDAAGVIELQRMSDAVHASEALTDYVLDLVEASRTAPELELGLSPRAGLSLVRSARAFALIDGRDSVIPEDVQAVAPAVIGHRIAHTLPAADRHALVRDLLGQVAVR